MFQFSQIESIVSGKRILFHQDMPVQYLLLDSRKIISPAFSLFFAIKGPRHDGHKYIREIYEKGVRNFIVEEGHAPEAADLPGSNILEVKSSISALQKIAAAHREKFKIPVTAVTGSNGKTIVKEWLSQLLSIDHVVVRSPRSFNSQVGVPLSVWEMDEQHTFGIFEAGISQPGEMENLEKIIRPDIGIFTNIGTAHDEGFESREQKIFEKLKLFASVDMLIYCRDHEEIHEALSRNLPYLKTFTWSFKHPADLQVKRTASGPQGTSLSAEYRKKRFSLFLPFSDEASIENLLHCVSAMLHLGIDPDIIQSRIGNLQPVAMRMEMKEGINGCYVIDDAYNNDLAGLSIALHFLSGQHQKEKKTLILSDLLETGMDEKSLYQNIAGQLKEKNIHRLIGIGKHISRNKDLFDSGASFFPDTDSFLQDFRPEDFFNEMILVKGARVFGFEKIVRQMQYKVHGTVLEVNLDALSHNLNYFRSRLNPGTKIMVMVKAFGYGSGSYDVANLLQFHRVDYLAVAYADEGADLRENGISLPVMVMNPSWQTFDKLIRYNLEPEIYSMKVLNEYAEFLKLHRLRSNVHLKIDTGMNRLGFGEKELEQLIKKIQVTPEITVASIFSHLAGADESAHNDFTVQQIAKFNEAAEMIEKRLGYRTLKHILNSAGIVRFPEAQLDMVRLGIGLYGAGLEGLGGESLQPVGTLKTIISQIRKIKKGETVGYGRKGVAEKDMRIATIAIGYADGFDRRFSNGKGKVMIKGVLCPVIGNVCMDMTMVDISNARAEEGDSVIIFGEEIFIDSQAREIGTISYEILTGVNDRVKRVFYTTEQ